MSVQELILNIQVMFHRQVKDLNTASPSCETHFGIKKPMENAGRMSQKAQ